MIGTPLQIIQWLYGKEKDKQFEIKEKRKKRSLSQNSYAWQLITEIGNLIGKSKEEVYFEMLKAYGQVSEISMLSSIDPKGYFKYYQKGYLIIENLQFIKFIKEVVSLIQKKCQFL